VRKGDICHSIFPSHEAVKGDMKGKDLIEGWEHESARWMGNRTEEKEEKGKEGQE
jgi:hypothetical protein